MRSRRRHEPLQHVLLAGCADDLLMIQSVLAVLPAHTYGQVLIETDEHTVLPILDAPARVTVHQLRHGAAEAAVDAWVGEWMPHRPDSCRTLSLWVGTGSSAYSGALEHGLPGLMHAI